MNDQERANLLEEAISVLDSCWELEEPCILPPELGMHLGYEDGEPVSNTDYDRFRRELKELRPDSTVFDGPTASKVQTTNKKIKHDPPMVSIEKASHEDLDTKEEMLFDFLVRCTAGAPPEIKNGPMFDLEAKTVEGVERATRKYKGEVVKYPRDWFYQEFKLDGVACSVEYIDGKFHRAGLRPRDGTNGEDVSEQIKYVDGVKMELPFPWTCSIRGEIICLRSDFEQVQKELVAAGEKIRANPRNHAGGGIRNFNNPEKVKPMRLRFVAYTVEGLENPPWKTEIERAKFCNQKGVVPFVQCKPFSFYDLPKLEQLAKTLDYETDGVVIGVNNLEQQVALGRHGDKPTGNPRGKIAWKFAEESSRVKVKRIVWQVGRTSITPVAIFDPVRLAGTTVTRATLHNLGFMIRNKIGIGTDVVVLKAGKIIPKVVGVVGGEVDQVEHVEYCPSCGRKARVLENPGKTAADTMYDLVCENEECPARNVEQLKHFLDIIGVLGVGHSKLMMLVENDLVAMPADLYRLTEKNCVDCGMSERQALLVIAGIHMIDKPYKVKDNDQLRKKIDESRKSKIVVPLWKVFAALGIEMAGKSAGKELVDHFRTFDAIRRASAEKLTEVKDVGEKTARVIFEYMRNNSDELDQLLHYLEPELPKEGPLIGKLFCLSGGFPGGKGKWEKAIEDQGGRCGGMSRKTSFLVQGEKPGADKQDAAERYSTPVIDLDKLKSILGI